MGLALLLAAGMVSAQSKPLQLFPPRSEPKSVTQQVLDAVKRPLNFTPAIAPKGSNCAIMLTVQPPITDPKMAVKAPSVDPKMAAMLPMAACAAKP